jgi:hypothetical protein
MPNLNDYIGSLVSSITNARVMSDLQTVKIAEEYANHKLLQHFSVPRMRIDDIEMTIPIGLHTVDEQLQKFIKPIDANNLNMVVYREILSVTGMGRMKVEVARLIQAAIAKETNTLEQKLTVANYEEMLKIYANTIADYSYSTLKKNGMLIKEVNPKLGPIAIANALLVVLKEQVSIKEKTAGLGHLEVIVEANKLRELKPETLIYIKVKIKEDGMEWNRLENNNGEIETKLLPE